MAGHHPDLLHSAGTVINQAIDPIGMPGISAAPSFIVSAGGEINIGSEINTPR